MIHTVSLNKIVRRSDLSVSRTLGSRKLTAFDFNFTVKLRYVTTVSCQAMSVTMLRQVRLRVGAGSAKPGPAIGQALGPLG